MSQIPKANEDLFRACIHGFVPATPYHGGHVLARHLQHPLPRQLGPAGYSSPRHPTHSNPHLFSNMTFYDVSSNICSEMTFHDVSSNICSEMAFYDVSSNICSEMAFNDMASNICQALP